MQEWPGGGGAKSPKDALLGFRVRSRGWIHALSVIYATFQPATWTPVPKELFTKSAVAAASAEQPAIA